MALFPSETICWRDVDERCVLLDLKNGEYIILDRVGSAMWLEALADASNAAENLAARFGVDKSEVRQDYNAFIADLRAKGHIADMPPAQVQKSSPPAASMLPLWMHAWWLLFQCQRALKAGRFNQLYSKLSTYSKPAPCDPTPERILQLRRAFRLAETFILLRSAPRDCLPRSIALYRYLLAAGIPVRHYIGVERFPFNAHAWVEDAHGPWFDDSDYVKEFTVLATL